MINDGNAEKNMINKNDVTGGHVAEAATELGRGNLHPSTSKKSATSMIYAAFTLPRSVESYPHSFAQFTCCIKLS